MTYYRVMVRYVVSFFLVALLLMLVGLTLGYLSLDTSATEERQLTASGSGALAYWEDCEYYGDCVYEYDGDPWYVFPEDQDMPPPPPDEWYWEEQEPIYIVDEPELFYADEWGDPRVYDYWWTEEYWIEEPVYITERPWYVSSFPGFGSMFQQIIPGQTHPTPVRAPAPPPSRPVYPQPSCWISAQPTSVEYGKSSTLQWSSFNASRASLTDFGNVPLSGSRVAQNITNDRVYQLSVSGQGGSGSCYTRITVRAPSGGPSCVISAYPSTISSGQSSSLAWGSESASSAYLSGVGTVAVQGGTYVAPQQTTTYTLTVFGSQGSSNTCTAQIGVLP
ncbi:hypothetical protein HYW59_03460 [Candidatus Kaiserbacteria bacterium]|nr:hypothetical protein [Candidatus Kaiserbacteria bacterium]